MKITPEHGRENADNIFINVEYMDVFDGVRGDLLDFDLIDNRGVADVMLETRGLRVLNHSTTGSFLDPFTAGILETDVAAVEVGAKRGRMVLAQIYGVHDSAQYGGSSLAPGDAYLVPHNGTRGAMSAQTTGTVTAAPAYVITSVGWNLENSGATFTRKAMFVKMM